MQQPLQMQQPSQIQQPLQHEAQMHQPQQESYNFNTGQQSSAPAPPAPNQCNSKIMGNLQSLVDEQIANENQAIGQKNTAEHKSNPKINLTISNGESILKQHQTAFDEFKKVNLMDEDSIKQLYTHHQYFLDKKFFCCMLESMYMLNYEDLIKKYNLQPYIRVWVVGLAYNSLNDICKHINNTQSVSSKSRLGQNTCRCRKDEIRNFRTIHNCQYNANEYYRFMRRTHMCRGWQSSLLLYVRS